MTAGAAYGAGIYASSNYGTSHGYTIRYGSSARSWNNSGFGLTNGYVIAICEIIKKPEYSKDPQNNICVITDEDEIIIRYLFVIKNQNYLNSDMNTSNIDFSKHYQKQLRIINDEYTMQRNQRIEEAYEKYNERKLKQKEEIKRI